MMIDGKYLKDILQQLEKGAYGGVVNTTLADKFAQESEDKFIYHMDEIWNAGLARPKIPMRDTTWGLMRHMSGQSIIQLPLVLTPLGSEVINELNKSKGLERLTQFLRSAGATAGAQAFKVAIDKLLAQSLT